MIKTETDYLNALSMAEAWMGVESGSKEEDMLRLLVDDILAYEEAHYPIEPPNLTEAIRFRKEQEKRL